MIHINSEHFDCIQSGIPFWRISVSVTNNIYNKWKVGLEKIELTFRELHLVQLRFTAAAV